MTKATHIRAVPTTWANDLVLCGECCGSFRMPDFYNPYRHACRVPIVNGMRVKAGLPPLPRDPAPLT